MPSDCPVDNGKTQQYRMNESSLLLLYMKVQLNLVWLSLEIKDINLY